MKVDYLPFASKNPLLFLYKKHLLLRGIDVSPLALSFDDKDFLHVPDILHLHWLLPIFADKSEVISYKKQQHALKFLDYLADRNVPIVWTVHNLSSHEGLYKDLEEELTVRVVNAAKEILVHSKNSFTQVESRFPASKPKLSIIPHPTFEGCYPPLINQAEARRVLNVAENKKVILFYGQLRGHKGVVEFAELFCRSNLKNSILIIAGEVPSPSLRARLESLKSDNLYLNFGYISETDTSLLFSACDLVALPYQSCFTSGVAHLAMTYLRPCLVPDQDYFREIFPSQSAFFYGKENAMLDEMLHDLDKQSLPIETVVGELPKIASQHRIDAICLKLAELYKRSL